MKFSQKSKIVKARQDQVQRVLEGLFPLIGVTANGNIIFLAADTGRTLPNGRGEGGGISVDAGANILRSMGAVTVLNLDGGGSTQMFYRDFGRVIHPPFDFSGSTPIYRPVGSVFLVW